MNEFHLHVKSCFALKICSHSKTAWRGSVRRPDWLTWRGMETCFWVVDCLLLLVSIYRKYSPNQCTGLLFYLICLSLIPFTLSALHIFSPWRDLYSLRRWLNFFNWYCGCSSMWLSVSAGGCHLESEPGQSRTDVLEDIWRFSAPNFNLSSLCYRSPNLFGRIGWSSCLAHTDLYIRTQSTEKKKKKRSMWSCARPNTLIAKVRCK